MLHAQSYIWGGSSDKNSTFEGGLNDWVIGGGYSALYDTAANGELVITNPYNYNPDCAWQWDSDGILDKGLYNTNLPALNSPTRSNGIIAFDSDFLDTGGSDKHAGIAPAPHSAYIESPAMDCSGHDIVILQFYQFISVFDVDTRVDISIDQGKNWISRDIATNQSLQPHSASPNGEQIRLDISDIAADSTDVRLRFVFSGSYFFWMIDDVALIEAPLVDVALTRDVNIMSNYTYVRNKGMFCAPIEFSARIINNGIANQSAITLHAEILNEQQETQFAATSTVAVPAGQTRQVVFMETWSILDSISVGKYQGRIWMNTPSGDIDANDNAFKFTFEVADSLLSKENEPTIGLRPATNNEFSVANYFNLCFNDQKDTLLLDHIEYSVGKYEGNSMVDPTVEVLLMKVDDQVVDDFSNFDLFSDVSNHPQLTTIWAQPYILSPNIDFEIISVKTRDSENNPLMLTSGKYLVVLKCLGESKWLSVGFDGSTYYDEVTTMVNTHDYWFLGGFGPSAATIRLAFTEPIDTTIIATTELDESEKDWVLLPNPALNYLTIHAPKESNLRSLEWRIINVYGQLVLQGTQDYSNQAIDITNLIPGFYYLEIADNKGLLLDSKPFIKSSGNF